MWYAPCALAYLESPGRVLSPESKSKGLILTKSLSSSTTVGTGSLLYSRNHLTSTGSNRNHQVVPVKVCSTTHNVALSEWADQSTFQSLSLSPENCACQPCPNLQDASILALVLVLPIPQDFSSWAISLWCMHFCEQILPVSKFFLFASFVSKILHWANMIL